jgi:hypothetical protein
LLVLLLWVVRVRGGHPAPKEGAQLLGEREGLAASRECHGSHGGRKRVVG